MVQYTNKNLISSILIKTNNDTRSKLAEIKLFKLHLKNLSISKKIYIILIFFIETIIINLDYVLPKFVRRQLKLYKD